MIQALIDNGRTPSVRMFDGCMIEGTVDNPEELLEKIEKYINSKYEDLNIQITTKPHDQTIQLPENYEIPIALAESPSTQYPSFQDLCTEFEKTHAKIIARSIFIHETDNDVIFMSAEKLKISFSHLVFLKLFMIKMVSPVVP